jgi:cytidylate kinase
MIISIRGTSGCGKTTLVRRVKDWWGDDWTPIIERDLQVENDKIVGYTSGKVFLCGPYKDGLQTGGVDGVKWGPFRGRDYRMDYYLQWANKGYHLISEGLMESAEFRRTVAWNESHPVHAIFLATPIEECLARINRRRRIRGVLEDVNPKLTVRKHEEVMRIQKRMVVAGVDARVMDSEAAFTYICELLEETGHDHE